MATQQFKISKVNVDLSKYTLTSSIEENWYRKEYVASNYTANSIVADNYFTKTYVATNYYLKNDIDTIQLDIKNAINNKGGTLTNEPFSSYATAINNLTISSGGGSSESSDPLTDFLSNAQMSFTYNGTSIARPCQLYVSEQNDTSSPVINMPNLTELPTYATSYNTALLRYFPYTGTLNMPNLTELPDFFSYYLFNIKSISEESLNTAFTKLNSFVANITTLGEYSLYYALGGHSYVLVDNIATDVLTRDLVLSFPNVNTIEDSSLAYCGVRNEVSNTSGTYSGTITKGFKISLPALTMASKMHCFKDLICGILSAPNASLNIENGYDNVFGYTSDFFENQNHLTHTVDISRLYYSTSGKYQGSYYVFAGWPSLQTLVIRGDYAPHTNFVVSSSDSSQRIFSTSCYCMLGTVNSSYNPNGIKGRIYVNDNQVDAYKSAPGWSAFADRIYPLSQYNEATRYDNTETYNYTDDSYVVIGSQYKNANTNYIINDAENTKVEIKFETVDTTANNYYIIGGCGNAGIKELYVNSFSNTGFSIKTALNKYGTNMTLSNYNQSSANILTFIGDTVLLNNTQLAFEYEYNSNATEQTVPLYIGAGAEDLSGTMNYLYGAEFKFYYMKIYTRANTTSDWTLIKDYRPRVGRGIVETISDTTLYNLNNETPLDNEYYNGGFGNVL